ncbi:MAG: VOC family protein [Actinomycetia bacterium]|nr:VOC family protein [Actinomycetes bacterium]
MSTHIAAITFDCVNAMTLAEFWSAALGRPIDPGEPAPGPFFARILGGEGSPTLMFIQVPEPKSVKNRAHLDLGTDNREAEVERLVGLGASRVHDKAEWGIEWTTLADPEGNEFCIAEH